MLLTAISGVSLLLASAGAQDAQSVVLTSTEWGAIQIELDRVRDFDARLRAIEGRYDLPGINADVPEDRGDWRVEYHVPEGDPYGLLWLDNTSDGIALRAQSVSGTAIEAVGPAVFHDELVAEEIGIEGVGVVIEATGRWAGPVPLAPGIIVMWSGSIGEIPPGWVLCDGRNGTPDLRDRFIYSISAGEEPGALGGALEHTHTGGIDNSGAHFHATTRGYARGNWVDACGYFGTTYLNIPVEVQQGYDGQCNNGGFGFDAYNTSTEAHDHEFVTDAEGHLPPYFKLAFIMRAYE